MQEEPWSGATVPPSPKPLRWRTIVIRVQQPSVLTTRDNKKKTLRERLREKRGRRRSQHRYPLGVIDRGRRYLGASRDIVRRKRSVYTTHGSSFAVPRESTRTRMTASQTTRKYQRTRVIVAASSLIVVPSRRRLSVVFFLSIFRVCSVRRIFTSR